MENDESCPFCGSDQISPFESAGLVKMVCHGCGARGSAKMTVEGARKAWNRRVGRKAGR